MTISITLTAADGATDTITLAEPTINSSVITSLQSVMIGIGDQVLDGTSGALVLAAPTGSPGQVWSLWTGNSGAQFLLNALNNGVVDWTTLKLSTVYDSTQSPQATWWIAPTATTPGEFQSGASGTTLALQVSNGALVMGPDATPAAIVLLAAPAQKPTGGGSYPPSGYVKVWEDTFTGTSLDTTKWWTRYPAPNDQWLPSNNEQEVYEEGQDGEPNHVMTGSSVKLTAYPPRASDGRYPSGMIRSKQALKTSSQTTAFYIEVVAKIPSAAGAWPAFWSGAAWKTAGTPPPWPPEIDFAEFMIQGSNPTSIIHQSIKFNNQLPGPWNGSDGVPTTPAGWTWANPSGDTQWDTDVDFSAGFHTFGVLYRPSTSSDTPFPNYWVTPEVLLPLVNPATGENTHFWMLSVDGEPEFAGQYDANVGADGSLGWNMSIILNLAVGGVGGGTPNNAEFPCAFEIQRVSIFLSQEDSTMLVPDTIGVDYLPATGG